MNDWRRLADAMRAIPEERRIFSTEFYEEHTSDTNVLCGCAVGQLMCNLGVQGSEELEHVLGVQDATLKVLFDINDLFKPGDDTEVTCRARYTHVLAECERRSDDP